MRRFLQRVAEKAKDVSQPPVVICAIGDSVTQGVMEQRMIDHEGVYHRLLQRELESFFPLTTFSTINAGVSGDTAQGGKGRLERDVLTHRPDLVIVGFGLNDALKGAGGIGEFEADFHEMIEMVQEKSSADIILLTPSFMARRRNSRIHADHEPYVDGILAAQTGQMVGRYAESIRLVARERNIHLADIQREWQRLSDDGFDTDTWLVNGLNHPDRRGHKLAASVIFAHIISQYLASE